MVFLAVVASPSGSAFAQSNAEADAAISKGVELRRQGKDEEALAQFQRAFGLSATPRAKAQMGLAEQAIGRWADAERDLGEAMTQASDPWITRQRAVLTEAMAVIRRHLGGLTIKGEPAGAIVELDGEPVGVIPMPERHVTAGEVVVTVRAAGYVTVTRKVGVTPGQLAAEVFRLKRIESESSAGVAGGGVTPPVVVVPIPPPPLPLPPDPPPSNRLRVAAWTTAAAGGAALAAGGAFLILAHGQLGKFNDPANGCGIDDAGALVGGSSCRSWHDSWNRNRTIGFVGLGVGAALAIVSGVLFYRIQADAPPASGARASALCSPAAGPAVSCLLRF